VAAQELLKKMRLYRRDMGSLLFHFTRQPEKPVVIGSGTLSASPSSVLEKIAADGFLQGSDGYIKGGYKCVCFMETPITEVASVFRLVDETAGLGMRPRYAPYGVAVPKEWLFVRGGRPVIYQPDTEYSVLPDELRWRHVRYELDKGIDFTWEREWRIQTERLVLEPEHTLFALPTAAEVFEFVYEHAKEEMDWDVAYGPDGEVEGIPMGTYHEAKWLAVSLDFFGVSV
jgi:hypothetical protein